MKRDFNEWLKTFRDSISTYDYYVDFKKIYLNVERIKVELNILNSLINSKNIKKDFDEIIKKYPDTLKCIPILLAVREKEIFACDEKGSFTYSFTKNDKNIDYSYFMEKTGLFDLLSNHIINNLYDYVTGVETGLDSNGRKNRGGHLMEDLVEDYIKSSDFEKGKNYFKEMYIHKINKKWGVDLSAISNQGTTEKRFDFVIKTNDNIYVIETNFYASSGSKLNEVARSYKQLSQEIDTINNVEFIWFTDGIGWNSAKNNLLETFCVMEHIYNIKDLEDGILKKIIK